LALSALPVSFFINDPVVVARQLLGMRLVRLLNGQRVGGIILEAEAYRGEEDLACHARVGRTPRTQVMYGPPGRAYVYFTYGMHWMLNCVTLPEGSPAAVLLRAIQPEEGLEEIAARRAGRPPSDWCSGPGKLTRSLAVTGELNGIDLCDPAGSLWIEEGTPVGPEAVLAGPRVGIDTVPEPWKSIAWRFRVRPVREA
jgi:DNA-3-methyladenine glycosylase